MELNNKMVMIIGMARSGIGSAKLCYQQGATVAIYDGKDKSGFEDIIHSLAEYNFTYYFGEFDKSLLDSLDYMILSPGVPTDLSFIEKAKDKGIKVIGEIELAYAFCKSEIIAITGTNGKTTTTSLVGEIINAIHSNTFVVGNIGNPFTNVVLDTKEDGIVVAEISSFQLESIKTFKPKVSAILNLTEDHLNRHKTFENYVGAKLRITENQDENDYSILNHEDELCKELAKKIRAQILWFSMKEEVEGVYFKNNKLMVNYNGIHEEIMSMMDVKLLGSHNIENIMAAIAISLCMNIPFETIKTIITSFKGVEHRIEFSGEIKGVKYYNDSKATNPDAAIKGIMAMVTPTVLIAGGMDKGSEYDQWIRSFDNKVKILILFGETKEKIKQSAILCGFHSVIIVNTLEEAVLQASRTAEEGDCVLLSPACASWDMFTSYEERGDLFKKLITTLTV
ncbi:MAG: UDP-N-acetylmuramoyl-L-alanine--D-glutamate ligase [Firmicutes bacterium HGW-Firmicutes-1]|jgi:UDP-N-acetylmuramoylalanine--D-glutamate ligase|nr:MAG: UDP-N-acetylmuramoyl-L-alanine--D-glutamate ligase [Firmicutes bacterium HGW-Firmicutes-1]